MVLRAIGIGAIVGTAVLGIGGRAAMRFYALRDYQEPYFTASGTLTVVMIAAAAGAATGFWLWLAGRLFPARRALKQAFFWTGLILLTLRVLQPVSQSRLEVFFPLAVAHGLLLSLVHRLSAADVVGLPGDGGRAG
jgi:ABC-type transport system involved in cytochrome c biogenesis permease subunit